MATSTTRLVSGIIALIGLFYFVAPHSLHVSSGLGLGADHTMHMFIGFILFIAAGALYILPKKKAV